MEEVDSEGWYRFHAGAPNAEQYTQALSELREKVDSVLAAHNIKPLRLDEIEHPQQIGAKNQIRLSEVYGDELVKIARERHDIVVLDADLIKSCGLIPFSKEFPGRFIECGIAEQDMVSMAGGIALEGKLPIVNSLACFLTPRPNEHIYTNATELTKIIYMGTQAGLLPAGPGHSHQSIRDISLLGSIPGMTIIEPCNDKETRMALRWAVYENPKSTYLRLSSVRMEIPYILPEEYALKKGQGVLLKNGSSSLIIAYGPVLLKEAWLAAEYLMSKRGISVAIMNLPWLNTIDEKWFFEAMKQYKFILTLDDHYTTFGQGMMISHALSKKDSPKPRIVTLGVKEIPACGANDETLRYHKLDWQSIVQIIEENLSC